MNKPMALLFKGKEYIAQPRPRYLYLPGNHTRDCPIIVAYKKWLTKTFPDRDFGGTFPEANSVIMFEGLKAIGVVMEPIQGFKINGYEFYYTPNFQTIYKGEYSYELTPDSVIYKFIMGQPYGKSKFPRVFLNYDIRAGRDNKSILIGCQEIGANDPTIIKLRKLLSKSTPKEKAVKVKESYLNIKK